MKNTVTRSILAGTFAAGQLLAAPMAASAAEPAHVSFSALFEGAQIPSSAAELKRTAAVGANVPVYSEPSSGGDSLQRRLPGITAGGAGSSRARVSEAFTVRGEQWVAVQVPESAHGTDAAKSNLADPGVAYMRAASARDIQGLGDAKVESYPHSKSDLVTITQLGGPMEMYKEPIASTEYSLNSPTDKWGTSLRSSTVFTYKGQPWVAVEAKEGLVPGGIAYISADPKFAIVGGAPAKASAPATTATTTSETTPAAIMPSADPSPSVTAKASPSRIAAGEPDVFAATVSKLPAVLFAVIVMGFTLLILNRRPA